VCLSVVLLVPLSQVEGELVSPNGEKYPAAETFHQGSPHWANFSKSNGALKSKYIAVHHYISQALRYRGATENIDANIREILRNATTRAFSEHYKVPKTARSFYENVMGKLLTEVSPGEPAGRKRPRPATADGEPVPVGALPVAAPATTGIAAVVPVAAAHAAAAPPTDL
jgi:hypothetical protein